jgi:UbiD family decarboxylase
MDLRTFLAWARAHGSLVVVERAVDVRLELARVAAALDGHAVLFPKLEGHEGWRAISGVCARRQHFAAALHCLGGNLVARMAAALEQRASPPVRTWGPCQQVVAPAVDLTSLPVLHHHPRDGGRYITAGVSFVRDPELGPNASIHRLMILDERRCVARLIEGRGTHTALSKVSGDLPIAVAVGCPVQVLLAAATSPAKGVDELTIAHALAPTPVVACLTADLYVPAEAELVLEGRITRQSVDEGPFPDLTGTMDIVRQQPVIEIDRITHRENPIYHVLLPAGLEHKNLMGMPREPTIFAAVNEVCRCIGVHITPGGSSWLHAVVQIEKERDEDGRRAILAAFRGHTSLKHVVVVDSDVDLYDPAQVEWAIATRFQVSRDLIVLTDEPGSSLDPSARQVPGQKSRTSKMGLDATMPAGLARDGYQQVRYEGIDLAGYTAFEEL